MVSSYPVVLYYIKFELTSHLQHSDQQFDNSSVPVTLSPSNYPSFSPSQVPSDWPSPFPSLLPTPLPSVTPSLMPSQPPSSTPSTEPSPLPTIMPSQFPSMIPSLPPSILTSNNPTTLRRSISAGEREPARPPSAADQVDKMPVSESTTIHAEVVFTVSVALLLMCFY